MLTRVYISAIKIPDEVCLVEDVVMISVYQLELS